MAIRFGRISRRLLRVKKTSEGMGGLFCWAVQRRSLLLASGYQLSWWFGFGWFGFGFELPGFWCGKLPNHSIQTDSDWPTLYNG